MKPQRQDVVAWVRLAMFLSAATLLAYGVIRAPDRGSIPQQAPRVLVAALGEARVAGMALKASVEAEPLRARPGAPGARLELIELPVGDPALAGQVLRGKLAGLVDPNDVVLVLAEAPGEAVRLEVQAFGEKGRRYLARLPLHDIQRKLKDQGYAAVISYSPENEAAGAALRAAVEDAVKDGPGARSRPRLGGLIQLPGRAASGKSAPEWGLWGARALRVALEASLSAR